MRQIHRNYKKYILQIKPNLYYTLLIIYSIKSCRYINACTDFKTVHIIPMYHMIIKILYTMITYFFLGRTALINNMPI